MALCKIHHLYALILISAVIIAPQQISYHVFITCILPEY